MLFVAGCRASVQVLLLGLLLAPVLVYRHWSILLAACGVMVALASAEAASRLRRSYPARASRGLGWLPSPCLNTRKHIGQRVQLGLVLKPASPWSTYIASKECA